VRLEAPALSKPGAYNEGEKPCFVIRQVKLEGDEAEHFRWALVAAKPGLGRCLGTAGINTLVGAIQNALIERGYVTSRVLAAPQDLQSGELHLKLVPGRIRAIRFADTMSRASYASALPARSGDFLDLRSIEQGLENFKRVPGTEADIQIVPGAQPGESDLVIKLSALVSGLPKCQKQLRFMVQRFQKKLEHCVIWLRITGELFPGREKEALHAWNTAL
jgi:hemolysin activation/secretion protein